MLKMFSSFLSLPFPFSLKFLIQSQWLLWLSVSGSFVFISTAGLKYWLYKLLQNDSILVDGEFLFNRLLVCVNWHSFFFIVILFFSRKHPLEWAVLCSDCRHSNHCRLLSLPLVFGSFRRRSIRSLYGNLWGQMHHWQYILFQSLGEEECIEWTKENKSTSIKSRLLVVGNK